MKLFYSYEEAFQYEKERNNTDFFGHNLVTVGKNRPTVDVLSEGRLFPTTEGQVDRFCDTDFLRPVNGGDMIKYIEPLMRKWGFKGRYRLLRQGWELVNLDELKYALRKEHELAKPKREARPYEEPRHKLDIFSRHKLGDAAFSESKRGSEVLFCRGSESNTDAIVSLLEREYLTEITSATDKFYPEYCQRFNVPHKETPTLLRCASYIMYVPAVKNSTEARKHYTIDFIDREGMGAVNVGFVDTLDTCLTYIDTARFYPSNEFFFSPRFKGGKAVVTDTLLPYGRCNVMEFDIEK